MGGYRELPPPPGLGGVVSALWRDDVAADRVQRVLPDGSLDIIWWGGRLIVAGPDATAQLFAIPAGDRMIGLRFAPGAGPAVLGMPADELTDQRVPLADVWPADADRLEDAIGRGNHPASVLLRAVAARLPERPDPALPLLVTRLRGGAAIGQLAAELGCTERAVHRRCRAAFGYGPAVLRRILRFRVALRLLEDGLGLADAAAVAGYADQPHFTREARALAGAPPGQLLGSGANRSTPLPSGSRTVA